MSTAERLNAIEHELTATRETVVRLSHIMHRWERTLEQEFQTVKELIREHTEDAKNGYIDIKGKLRDLQSVVSIISNVAIDAPAPKR